MLDIHGVMARLSETRPIFHSEADFQHALAWRIHEMMTDSQVRLECNLFPNEMGRRYLDIWLPTVGVSIELKYRKRRLELTTPEGERFALTYHRAQDQGRYDFLKDIQRVEQLVVQGRAKTGFAILLTNDPSYWSLGQKADPVDAAFHIYEGREVAGSMAWSEEASPKTKEGREEPITLTASYTLRWQDYSKFPERGYSQFRYLAVAVGV